MHNIYIWKNKKKMQVNTNRRYWTDDRVECVHLSCVLLRFLNSLIYIFFSYFFLLSSNQNFWRRSKRHMNMWAHLSGENLDWDLPTHHGFIVSTFNWTESINRYNHLQKNLKLKVCRKNNNWRSIPISEIIDFLKLGRITKREAFSVCFF